MRRGLLGMQRGVKLIEPYNRCYAGARLVPTPGTTLSTTPESIPRPTIDPIIDPTIDPIIDPTIDPIMCQRLGSKLESKPCRHF